MRFLHCAHAEFLLVIPRLTRTRLGIALLALGTTLVWLSVHAFDALTVTLQAGALGAILGAAAIVGDESDRAALSTALTHPTTPLAIVTGRWLAIVVPAWALVMVCSIATGWRIDGVVAGIIAAAAVGSLRWPSCSGWAAAWRWRSSSLWRSRARSHRNDWSISHAPGSCG